MSTAAFDYGMPTLPAFLIRDAESEAEIENRLTLAEALEHGLTRLPLEERAPPDIAALMDQLGER